jgi:V8-like Glu-specific endopeptidase
MQQLTALLGLLALMTDCNRGPETDLDPFAGAAAAASADPDKILNGTAGPTLFDIPAGQVQAIGALRQADQVFCTATLIAPQVVVSAAHCALAVSGDVDFAIGRDARDPTAAIPVTRIVAHPKYDQLATFISAQYDVAIFVLAQPAKSRVSTIKPIPFNATAVSDLRGRQVQNVGYGLTRAGGQSSGRRYWSAERVAAVSRYDFTTRYSDNDSGTCNGDSGGPSLLRVDGKVVIVGTVSWGDTGCRGEGHFALASYHARWVQQQVAAVAADGAESGDDDGADGSAVAAGCGDIGYQGACQGEVAVWCEDGALQRRDCADDDQVCGDTGGALGYYCLEPDAGDASAGCQEYSYAGTCEGSVAVWCENGQVLWYDCADDGLACGWVAAESGYWCR